METDSTFAPQTIAALPAKRYLNNEYGIKSGLLTQDHKRIAILYLLTTIFFFVIGGCAAAIIRLELLTPAGDLVAADTYNKLFSIHGIIMVFFFLVPIAPAVLGNFLIPLMIGTRDVALPKINLFSWYLFVIGGCVELYMMIFGGVDTGWTFTTPCGRLPGRLYSPEEGRTDIWDGSAIVH
jgi:cytochrome c oxidase subunit I